MKTSPILFSFLASALLLSGCATNPAPNAGFVSGSQMSEPHHAKFLQRTWISPKLKNISFQQQFDAVYIAPVNTSYLGKQTWWQLQTNAETRAELEANAAKLANDLRLQLAREIASYPGHHYRIASAPGPRTLCIELALVELVPSKAFWNAGATAAGFVVPGAHALTALGAGSIAMEGRLRDGGSGEVIAMFADRRKDQVAPINVRGMTWYGGASKNIEIWAKEGAEFLNLPPGETVERKGRLTLKPW